jgi:hypothetical protein
MNSSDRSLLTLYRRCLWLYPRHLQSNYSSQLLQTIRDARHEAKSPFRFWTGIFADLLQSSLRERILMTQTRVIARPILVHAITLSLIVTVLGVLCTMVVQQMLRRGANQPQLQMADLYAAEIASGVTPNEAIPRAYIDLERSLESFVIAYDDQSRPVASTGYLNQAIPAPPAGVFKYLRTHSVDVVTWQPQSDVRIAAVIRRISGPAPGFVLTGRSLRMVEEQESQLYTMAFGVWLFLIALIVGGAAFLGRTQRLQASTA